MGKLEFIKRVLEAGFDTEMLEPSDILGTVTVQILAAHLPPAVKARLIKASLEADVMNAQLIIDTVGFENLAEHIPVHRVWEVIAAAATGGDLPKTPTTSKPRARVPGKKNETQADTPAERVLRDVRAKTVPEMTEPSEPMIARDPPQTITEGVQVERKRRRSSRVLPPSPPGATTRARSASKPLAERKPNVTADEPPAPSALPDITATSPPAPPRVHGRPGTLDRALDALEMDADEPPPLGSPAGFDDPTRAGQPLPRPDTFGPDTTDVFASDQLAREHEKREGENFEEDTNPGAGTGAVQDEF